MVKIVTDKSHAYNKEHFTVIFSHVELMPIRTKSELKLACHVFLMNMRNYYETCTRVCVCVCVCVGAGVCVYLCVLLSPL